ncbi:MAG: hypothetical protein FRX48_09322 [Lasallia pustulata]|uniref:Homeobox domain-containing protein n=1 Tax=Lasallia pustulata TaxID=136370 RepID=A0A5M8PD14_9LECA|nr:MAG: hypothetical protein FRX48_09322 [Lasallia pustulata]
MDAKDAVSDATIAPSISERHSTSAPDLARGSFAFLVHSQDTLTNNLPPNVDNQPLARQKRRRTSPEDQAILEAEYQRNPKPDKAARVAIVNRVALGEKEVQIWFQNRRQMTRRKSRPLSPEEIMASLSSSQGRTSSMAFSRPAFQSSQQHAAPSQRSLSGDCISPKASPEQTAVKAATAPDAPCAEPQVVGRASPDTPQSLSASNPIAEDVSALLPTVPMPTETCNSRQSTEHPTCGNISDTLPQPSTPSTVGLGYLANRRSAPSIQQNASLQQFVPVTSQPTTSSAMHVAALGEIPALSHPLKRTSSLIRLSMSLEGKAQVTTDDGSSPSPPRSQPLPVGTSQRPAGLQRSKSAIAPGSPFSPCSDVMPLQVPRRTVTGRSRDARTWEFYCDSDARNALTEQAEQEQSGSAIGIIGLIRSRSNKALSANPNKRNAQAPSNEGMKRMKLSVQKSVKPKLSRTTSSVARLQTGNDDVQKTASVKENWKPSSQPTPVQASSGDSDKENWEPGTQYSNVRRARAPNASSQARRAILKESADIPSHSSSLDALLNQENISPRRPSVRPRGGGEGSDGDVDGDEEVAAFMSCSSAAGEEEDLDCVQNLLSLSQGAWR